MSEMINNAQSITVLAQQLNMTVVQLNVWVTQIKNTIKARKDAAVKREADSHKRYKDLVAKLQSAKNKMINGGAHIILPLNQKSTSEFVSTISNAAKHEASSVLSGVSSFIKNDKGDVYKRMIELLTLTEDHLRHLLDYFTKHDVSNEESKIIQERNVKEPIVNPEKHESAIGEKLKDLMKEGSDLLFAAMFNPVEFKDILETWLSAATVTKILSTVLKPRVIGLLGSIGWAVSDGIATYAMGKNWKTSDISAALGGALGGTGNGGVLMNVFSNAGKYALLGVTIGSAFGPVGIIAGGLIGAAVGGILGWIGPEKIAQSIQVITDWGNQIIDGMFVGGKIQKAMDDANKTIADSAANNVTLTNQLVDLQTQLNTAIAKGDTSQTDALQKKIAVVQSNIETNQQKIAEAQKLAKELAEYKQAVSDMMSNDANKRKQAIDIVFKFHDDAYNAALVKLRQTGDLWSSDKSPYLDYTDKFKLYATRVLDTFGASLHTEFDNANKDFYNQILKPIGDLFSSAGIEWDVLWGNIGAGIQQEIDNANKDFESQIVKPFVSLWNKITNWWNTTINKMAYLITNPVQAAIDAASGKGALDHDPDYFKTPTPGQQSAITRGINGITLGGGLNPTMSITPPTPALAPISGDAVVSDVAKQLRLQQQATQFTNELKSQTGPNGGAAIVAPTVNNSKTDNRVITSVNNTNVLGGGLPATENTFLGGLGWQYVTPGL